MPETYELLVDDPLRERFAAIVGNWVTGDRADFVGKRMLIPIKLTEAQRDQLAWGDAVRWLEEHAAAEREWPWPRWEHYRHE